MPNLEPSKAKTPATPATTDVFDAMRHEMNRLFDTFDRGWPSLPSLFTRGNGGEFVGCDIDVRDQGNSIIVEAEIPGVAEKDVTVTFANGVLTLAGEKKTEHEEKTSDFYMSERSFGSFRRSLRLPDTIDEAKIEATFDKGVLRITAMKKPEAVKAERKIEVKPAS